MNTAPSTRLAALAQFRPAIAGSTVVALVGLSQVLAVGALSATPLGREAFAMAIAAAFVAATVGAFFVAIVGRAPAEVCGPRTSIGVIYAALAADLMTRAGPSATIGEIWATLAVAVMLMGVLQAFAGWLRLGEAVKFIPFPVNAGFVTGIGVLIVWAQVGPILGLGGRLSQYNWSALSEAIRPGAFLVAATTVLVIWTAPHIPGVKRLQPSLAGLFAGTAVHHLVAAFDAAALGPAVGALSPGATAAANAWILWHQFNVPWLIDALGRVMPYAAFLALQAVMNAALTSVSVSHVTGIRTSVNRTLVAQGLGNVICGALAALPIGTSPSQSMAAAKMKGVQALVPVGSPLLLLAAVLSVGAVLSYIPVAALAGILITVGAGMVDRWARDLLRRSLRGSTRDTVIVWNVVIVAAVAGAFIFGGVPLALAAGAVLAMVLLAYNLSQATKLGADNGATWASTRVWPREQSRWLTQARRAIAVFRPRGALFFGTADQLASQLEALPADIAFCVIDLSRLTTLDSTGCQIVAASARKLGAAGVDCLLAGLDPAQPREQALIALGLTAPDPGTRWYPDLDRALESIEAKMLGARWPTLSFDAPVPLSDGPLGAGLSAIELGTLTQCLELRELEAGFVFRSGDAGSSMFVIDSGFVEIRLGEPVDGVQTRLAAFGPGSIFGEVAMLASDRRTADAICRVPTRLYELTRERLLRIEADHPALYARLVNNLAVHLANRLVVATDIVRTRI